MKLKMESEMEKRAKAYSKCNTKVFIIENSKYHEKYWNGYIKQVETDLLVFVDEMTGREFPILLEDIKLMEVSKRGGQAGERFP